MFFSLFSFFDLFLTILSTLVLVVGLLMSMAFLTLFESKLLASMQSSKGPNVTGPWGLLQPLADGAKLFMKESMVPRPANKFMFMLAPMLTFGLSFLAWGVIPFESAFTLSSVKFSILYFLVVSSFGVYGILLAGWSSNSKYSFLGALRSTAQMISYEVSMGLIFLNVILATGTLEFSDILDGQKYIWYLLPYFFIAMLFFISGLAESNSHPFDLVEAEAELVAGYNTEYSGMPFSLFFLGEYGHMMMMSSMFATVFLGGPNIIFMLKSSMIYFTMKMLFGLSLFVMISGSFPSFRYDQLMSFGWKVMLPISLSTLVIYAIMFKYLLIYLPPSF